MYDKSLLSSLNEDKAEMLDSVNNNESRLLSALELIAKDGVCEKTYAQIFRMMFYEHQDASNRLAYSPDAKSWYWGEKMLSDMEVIARFAAAVKFLRLYMNMSWKMCQLGAVSPLWINFKEYAKTDSQLDTMESFAKLRTCLRLAAEIMPQSEKNSAKIDWSSFGEDSDMPDAPEEMDDLDDVD